MEIEEIKKYYGFENLYTNPPNLLQKLQIQSKTLHQIPPK